jgi:membrane protein
VVLAVFQGVGGLQKIYPEIEAIILSTFRDATGVTVTSYIQRTIGAINPKTMGVTAVAFLYFSLIGLLRNIDVAFHHIWKIKAKKPFFRRMWIHWMVLLTTPILLAVYLGLRSVKWVTPSEGVDFSVLLVPATLTLFLWVLYVVIPEIKIHKVSALIAAGLASLALLAVQNSFLWLSLKIFKRNKIYGSFASIPIFLFWLLVIWYVILTGVSFCAFLQQKIFKKP